MSPSIDAHDSDSARPGRGGLTTAVQDYAKAVYELQERAGGTVRTGPLAERMGVTAGSASAMVAKLAALGLVSRVPYRGVRLTPRGHRAALEVLRHHRLLELYLCESLGVPWDRVHEEAEVLEHVLSEDLEQRIAAQLGDPGRDPHGDPIPTRDGRVEEPPTAALSSLEAGAKGRFVRVSDADPGILRYLSERGIAPGDDLEVIERRPFESGLLVRFGDAVHALGRELAAAMRVEAAP